MAGSGTQEAVWSVYVILCENRELFVGITKNVERRLKEQFSMGAKTSRQLLANKPLLPIKKYKSQIKDKAIKKKKFIKTLISKDKDDFIMKSLLKRRKSPVIFKTDDGKFNIECPECKITTKLGCDQSRLELEFITYKCVHEILKEEMDALFEEAILAAACFHNGRFMFQGKGTDRALDSLLGFSERQHRKRTMYGYMLIDEISFKNSYLLLGAILEEAYHLILKHVNSHTFNAMDSKLRLPKSYNRNTFKKIKEINFSRKVRYLNLAYCTQLIANILKHTGGIIENKESGSDLINLFNRSKIVNNGIDLVSVRNLIEIEKIQIDNLFLVISRLYVCMIDLISEVFRIQHFRLTNINHNEIIGNIVNYDTREEFITYLKSIKDGSVMFMNLE